MSTWITIKFACLFAFFVTVIESRSNVLGTPLILQKYLHYEYVETLNFWKGQLDLNTGFYLSNDHEISTTAKIMNGIHAHWFSTTALCMILMSNNGLTGKLYAY